MFLYKSDNLTNLGNEFRSSASAQVQLASPFSQPLGFLSATLWKFSELLNCDNRTQTKHKVQNASSKKTLYQLLVHIWHRFQDSTFSNSWDQNINKSCYSQVHSFLWTTNSLLSCLWKYSQLAIKMPYECISSFAMIAFKSVACCGRSVTACQVSLKIPESIESLNEMHFPSWS